MGSCSKLFIVCTVTVPVLYALSHTVSRQYPGILYIMYRYRYLGA